MFVIINISKIIIISILPPLIIISSSLSTNQYRTRTYL